MVSKNFQQNGRPMHQQRQGLRQGMATAFKKQPFKQGAPGFNPMFNASQIPDNPGYMDFNNPTPPIAATTTSNLQTAVAKKKNNKNKQKNKPQPQLQPPINNNWNKNKQGTMGVGGRIGGPNTRFNSGGPRFNPVGPPVGPNRPVRRIMPGPIRGPRGGPMPHMPMPHPHFQPPMIPPMPPHMGRGHMIPPPMGVQPPLFLRRSGRGGPPMPIPPMMPPRMPRGIPPPMPFNAGGKIKKPNPKAIKKAIKAGAGGGKSTIKTLKNLINQYPIDKPWVTEAIRTEHDTKLDIENRLKGKKDDELFAQFKIQRDKFVGMYEAAREEYLKKEAAAVKAAKDAKDKQTINKTAAKNGNTKEAIPKKEAKATEA